MQRIDKLERRLTELEARSSSASFTSAPVAPVVAATPLPGSTSSEKPELTKDDRGGLDFLRETTLNMTLDGYYAYNFNRPAGHVNLLRAFDVSSNSFGLNQATFVVEHAPDVAKGRRFGARVDLQYGQATEALQGSAGNELRPQVYRPVYEAYGTYIAPIGHGLQIDFGKWSSSLGVESNFTKDNLNYSRSYLYTFLPAYHFGVRAAYDVTPKVNVAYWLVNGIQQSEDFNGFKSQALILTLKPTAKVSWNVNYYTGVEGRSIVSALNPGIPVLPTQPGLSGAKIVPAPDGREHILDSYVTVNATPRLTLVGEADYVINRQFRNSHNQHVTGGAAYARYAFTPHFALAARGEYLSDRGGLFSGLGQALKEGTLTADYKVADGFLVRTEWRRDFSNRPFFLSDVPGLLKKQQTTSTLGLVWWFGGKQGAW